MHPPCDASLVAGVSEELEELDGIVGGLDGDGRRPGCRGVAPHGVDRAQT
jgi:hypothetical protein